MNYLLVLLQNMHLGKTTKIKPYVCDPQKTQFYQISANLDHFHPELWLSKILTQFI